MLWGRGAGTLPSIAAIAGATAGSGAWCVLVPIRGARLGPHLPPFCGHPPTADVPTPGDVTDGDLPSPHGEEQGPAKLVAPGLLSYEEEMAIRCPAQYLEYVMTQVPCVEATDVTGFTILGSGGFADVVSANLPGWSKPLAIKFPRVPEGCPHSLETMLCIEVRGLRMLQNVPDTLSVQAIITHSGCPLGVATLLCNLGSLADYLRWAVWGWGAVAGKGRAGCP